MKRITIIIIALAATFASLNAKSKKNHMFFDLAGVYMGTTNEQFKKDILSQGAIIPSIGTLEFQNTYDIFYEGEIIRIFSINHEKQNHVDRIGVMICRDSKDEILHLLKTFTKMELSKHNCTFEEFEANGYTAYALLAFSLKDEEQKKDPIGIIDIRIRFDEDNLKYILQVIYDDWVD